MKNPLIANLPEVYLDDFYKQLRKGKLIMDVWDVEAKTLNVAEITIRRSDCQDKLFNDYASDYIKRYNKLCASHHSVTLSLRTRLGVYCDELCAGRDSAMWKPRIDKGTIEIFRKTPKEHIISGRDENGHKLSLETVAHLGAFFAYLRGFALFVMKDNYADLSKVYANDYVPNFDIVDVIYHKLDLDEAARREMKSTQLSLASARRKIRQMPIY